jgi:hypothetical protein
LRRGGVEERPVRADGQELVGVDAAVRRGQRATPTTRSWIW